MGNRCSKKYLKIFQNISIVYGCQSFRWYVFNFDLSSHVEEEQVSMVSWSNYAEAIPTISFSRFLCVSGRAYQAARQWQCCAWGSVRQWSHQCQQCVVTRQSWHQCHTRHLSHSVACRHYTRQHASQHDQWRPESRTVATRCWYHCHGHLLSSPVCGSGLS